MRSFLIFLRSQIQGSGLHRAQILSGLLRHLDGGPGLAARDHVPSNVNLIISEIKINFKNHILEKFLREYKLESKSIGGKQLIVCIVIRLIANPRES